MPYFPANRRRPMRRPLSAGSIVSHEAAAAGAVVEVELAVVPPTGRPAAARVWKCFV